MFFRSLYRRGLFMKVVMPWATSIALVLWAIFRNYNTRVPQGLHWWDTDELIVMAVFGFLLGAGLFLLYRSTLLRRQIRRIGPACLNCGYSLKALPEAGECPECGEPYSAGEIAEAWAELTGRRLPIK